MGDLGITVFLILALFLLLGTGVWIGLTLLGVAWVGMEAWWEPGGIWPWVFAAITLWGVWDFFLSGKYRQPERG